METAKASDGFTGPFRSKSPKAETGPPVELDEKQEIQVAEDSGVADMPVSAEDKTRKFRKKRSDEQLSPGLKQQQSV